MNTATFTDDGGWCWFQDPRAIRHVGNRDRTYVGWITRWGDIEVGCYDHEAATVETNTLHTDYERDDHDDPVFAIRPDGRLLVFYSKHNGPTIDYRRSLDPESIAAFGPEQSIDVGTPDPNLTYPNPRWIDGDLYLFCRNVEAGEGQIVYVVSNDDGDTWSDQRSILTTGGDGWCIYPKISRPHDGKVHFGLTHALSFSSNPHRHVAHAAFDGERLSAADGNILHDAGKGTEPLQFDNVPRVFDSDDHGSDAWIWDCSIAGGNPQLTYAEFISKSEHRYRYACWNGSNWEEEFLCHAGTSIVSGEDNPEQYYSGGVVLDHDEQGVCYTSTGSHHSSALDRWQRETEGWRVERISDPAVQNIRPVVPWNRADGLKVCWAQGSYTYWKDGSFSVDEGAAFQTAIVGHNDAK